MSGSQGGPTYLLVQHEEDQKAAIRINLPEGSVDKDGCVSYATIDRLYKDEFPGMNLPMHNVSYYLTEINDFIPLRVDQRVPKMSGSKDCIRLSVLTKRQKDKGIYHQKLEKNSNWNNPRMAKRLDKMDLILADLEGHLIEISERLLDPLAQVGNNNFDDAEMEPFDTSLDEPLALRREDSNSTQEEGSTDSRLRPYLGLDKKTLSCAEGFSRMPPIPVLKQQYSTPAKYNNVLSNLNLVPANVDIAVVYSSPLVEIIDRKFFSFQALMRNDVYNFGDDVYDYVKVLSRAKKMLNVEVECASLGGFIKILKDQPSILHLNCHSDWHLESKSVCLHFENSKLDLIRVSPSNLHEMVGSDLSNITLIILSAPFAKSFVDLFLSLGVKIVIHINEEHTVDDNNKSGKKFCKQLYESLVNGSTINEAYDAGLNNIAVVQHESFMCCCYHGHLDKCRWLEKVKSLSISEAHPWHNNVCDCSDRMHMVHRLDCPVAVRMVKKNGFKQAIVEVDEGNDEDSEDNKPSDSKTTDGTGKSSSEPLVRLCCCKPYLKHDNTMKVKIVYKDNHRGYGDEAPFKNTAQGALMSPNNHVIKEPVYKDLMCIGMEKVLRNLYNSVVFNRKRIILLVGEPGTGKTSVAKQLSLLLIERRGIADVRLINMDKINNLTVFASRIGRATSLLNHTSLIDSIPQEANTLVILENLEYLLETNAAEFFKMLSSILESSKLRFVIICRSKDIIFASPNADILQFVEEVVDMPSISNQKAARILQVFTHGQILSEELGLKDLQTHSILEMMPGQKLILRRLFDIAFLCKKGLNLNEIQEELDREASFDEIDAQEESDQEKIELFT